MGPERQCNLLSLEPRRRVGDLEDHDQVREKPTAQPWASVITLLCRNRYHCHPKAYSPKDLTGTPAPSRIAGWRYSLPDPSRSTLRMTIVGGFQQDMFTSNSAFTPSSSVPALIRLRLCR